MGGGFSRGFSREEAIRSTLYARERKERSAKGKRRRGREGSYEREQESARDRAPTEEGGGEGAKSGLRRVLSTQDRHPATCQQTLPTREEHVGEKSPGKHGGWRERAEIERGRGRKDVRLRAYEGARRTEAASRRVLPRRARSDAARLSRRGKREGGGGGRERRGGGGKDAHSFLESRGPLLMPRLFPFVAREIRIAFDRRRCGLGRCLKGGYDYR